MGTVSYVVMIKPRPGHLEAFMKDLGRVSTIVKRAGARMRAWNQTSGPDAGVVGVVIENDDWKAYAAYRSKLDSDPEFQKLRAEIEARKDPVAETISTGMNEEVAS